MGWRVIHLTNPAIRRCPSGSNPGERIGRRPVLGGLGAGGGGVAPAKRSLPTAASTASLCSFHDKGRKSGSGEQSSRFGAVDLVNPHRYSWEIIGQEHEVLSGCLLPCAAKWVRWKLHFVFTMFSFSVESCYKNHVPTVKPPLCDTTEP
ncbi:unnamed protein product, partial [Urochloa humidicola]